MASLGNRARLARRVVKVESEPGVGGVGRRDRGAVVGCPTLMVLVFESRIQSIREER